VGQGPPLVQICQLPSPPRGEPVPSSLSFVLFVSPPLGCRDGGSLPTPSHLLPPRSSCRTSFMSPTSHPHTHSRYITPVAPLTHTTPACFGVYGLLNSTARINPAVRTATVAARTRRRALTAPCRAARTHTRRRALTATESPARYLPLPHNATICLFTPSVRRHTRCQALRTTHVPGYTTSRQLDAATCYMPAAVPLCAAPHHVRRAPSMASLRHAVSRRFDWRIHGDTTRGRVHHHRRRPPVEIVLVRLDLWAVECP